MYQIMYHACEKKNTMANIAFSLKILNSLEEQ